MRLPSVNNAADQNISRVLPKMNDDSCYENNATLIKSQPYLNRIEENRADFAIIPRLEQNFDGDFDLQPPDVTGCRSVESEVKSLKEWLILHTDLIQQQNELIIEKDRRIFGLQQEIGSLREEVLCLKKGIPYQDNKAVPDGSPVPSVAEDIMTQDSSGHFENDTKDNVLVESQEDENVCPVESANYTEIPVDVEENDFKSEGCVSDSVKTESDDLAECGKESFSEYNFSVNNFCEFDPMKNIKMSIRRKRVSSSSVVSCGDTGTLGEKKTGRKMKRKKRRRLGKDTQVMTSDVPYYVVQENESNFMEPSASEIEGATLEVPRWRLKHYTSCYTMEGTENLDDEVYNKRHLRLETDERRRKRWDVQRIREQRVIEKLKQRQERIGNGSKNENDQATLTSFWPKLEDIKYLEVTDELPVTAFGHPVPRVGNKDFILPWLNNQSPIVSTRSSSQVGKQLTIGKRKKLRNRI